MHRARQPSRKRFGRRLAAAVCASALLAHAAGEGTGIVVNGRALSVGTVRDLQQVYPVAIARGK